MRKIIVTLALHALLVSSTAASATEVSLKLDDGAQNAVAQLPSLLDQCVSSIMLRGDSTVCKSVSNFLISLANETRSVAVKAAADAKVAADKAAADAKVAADAKAAEDAKKAADKPASN